MCRQRRTIAGAAIAGLAGILLGCSSLRGKPGGVASCRESVRATLWAALASHDVSVGTARWRRGSSSHVDWYAIGCVVPSRLLPDGQWIEYGLDAGHGYFRSFGPNDPPTDAWGGSTYACWMIERIGDAPHFREPLLRIMRSQSLEPQLRCQALRALSTALDRATASLLWESLDDPYIGMEATYALAENPRLALSIFRRAALPGSTLARSRALWIMQENCLDLDSRDLQLVAEELVGPCSAQALSVLLKTHTKQPREVAVVAAATVEQSDKAHMAYALGILAHEWIDSVGASARTHARVGIGMTRELALQYLGLSPSAEDLAFVLSLAEADTQPLAVRASALLALSENCSASNVWADVALQMTSSQTLRVAALYALSRARALPDPILAMIEPFVDDPDPHVSQLARTIREQR